MPIVVVLDPPLVTDSVSTFNSKAFQFNQDLVDFATEANALETNVNAKEATASTAATTATTQAGIATTQAGSATTSASTATTKAAEAAASALAAMGSAAFVDSNPVVKGSADATKQVRFEVDGLTTATTRIVTVPNKDGTLAMTSDFATPGPIGSTTRDTIAATSVNANAGITSTRTTGAAFTASADANYALFDGATNSSGGRFAVTGNTTGSGINAWAYNAAASGYEPFNITGSTINLKPANTTVVAVSSTGAAVTGTLSATTTSTNEFSVNAAANQEAAVKIATAGGVYGRFFLASPAANSKIGLDCQGTTVMTILNGQSLALQGATTATGTGITFPATQSASADPNTLDDFERGSWTPVLRFGTASVGITYTVQSGTYIKIANLVTVVFRIALSSKGSSTGAADISGLPFTAATVSGAGSGAGSPIYWASFTTTAPTSVDAYQATLQLRIGGTTVTSATDANFQNGSSLYMSCTYAV